MAPIKTVNKKVHVALHEGQASYYYMLPTHSYRGGLSGCQAGNWRQLDSLGELAMYAVYEVNRSSFVSMPGRAENGQVSLPKVGT
jgi:hypothetical protein